MAQFLSHCVILYTECDPVCQVYVNDENRYACTVAFTLLMSCYESNKSHLKRLWTHVIQTEGILKKKVFSHSTGKLLLPEAGHLF